MQWYRKYFSGKFIAERQNVLNHTGWKEWADKLLWMQLCSVYAYRGVWHCKQGVFSEHSG